MQPQLIKSEGHRPATPRYEQLLLERVQAGMQYVDALSHSAAHEEAERLFRRIERLDTQLSRFMRYSHDEHRTVVPVEDARWHVPGEPPAAPPECRLCAKATLGLPLDLVLPMLGESTPGLGRAA